MPDTTTLDAPITAVTVFRDGARVQRSGTVSMVPGRQAAVIGGLPASVDPASVRVAARGPGLTLLNVEVHRGYRTDPRLEETEQRAGQPAAYTDVSAILDADAAAEAVVELSYHVPGASWRPLYDLTLDGEQLMVSYLAEVTQQTGEDWPAVELVLATTRRGRHQGLPELDPWYIGKAAAVPPAMPRMARKAFAFTAAAG